MQLSDKYVKDLSLLGGRLSLDFANTADWHASDQPVEYLTSYAALVAWGRHVGLLNEEEAKHLREQARHHPAQAEAAHERAVALRETMYRIFSAISAGLPAADDDLAAFNAELARAMGSSQVVRSGEGYNWDWRGTEGTLDRVLWPVVRDAAELMTSQDLDRVGQCADDRCGWLFLDTSRSQNRRWCSMEDCGNRAKARRYYRRSRAAHDHERERQA